MRRAAVACVWTLLACGSAPPAADDAGQAVDAGVTDAVPVEPPPDARPVLFEAERRIGSMWVDAPSVFISVEPPTCPLEGPEICYPPVPLIQRGSVLDGSITAVVEGLYPAGRVDGDATHVYFLQQLDSVGGTEIQRVERSGGTAATVASGARRFAIDDSYVYWLDNFGRIIRAELDGANPVQLATVMEFPSMAPVGDRLYWSDPGVPAIFSIPRAGGVEPTVVADGVAGPLEERNGFLYWMEPVGDATAILRVPTGGGEIETVFEGEWGVAAFDVDDEHVYWLNAEYGWIKRVPVAGGEVTLLLRDLGFATLFAVDDDRMYWVVYQWVYAAPKP